MAPRPYSERTVLPNEADFSESLTSIPPQVLPESPSPLTLISTRTLSPIPTEIIATAPLSDVTDAQEETTDLFDNVLCYPTPDDIMPYDHSLPDFIKQITNQPNLANLESLSLRVISTLISLHRMASYLPNLRELDLEGSVLNSLRDIGCGLKNLQILKVGRCQLESLDGTFGLTNLRELYAQKNFINDVSSCSNLPHIRHIDVSGNRIRNINYAGFLSVCSKLKSIVFTGNPATEVTDYRKHVRSILPQIETLDGVPFYNEEIGEQFKEIESMDNLSDDSVVASNFLSISPSESIISFLDFEDDSFFDKEKSNQATNVSHPLNVNDCEVSKTLIDPSPQTDLQEFQNLCLQVNEAENLNGNFNCVLSETSFSAAKNQTSQTASNDTILLQNDSKGKNMIFDKSNQQGSSLPSIEILSKINVERLISFEAVKKRPSNACKKYVKDMCGRKFEFGQLTTGAPVCGSLAVALRNRKKIQNFWNEKPQTNLITTSKKEAEGHTKNLLIQSNSSENTKEVQYLANKHNLIEKDVLLSSKKWREEFCRYRSNNRDVLEEENHKVCPHLLGESLKEELKTDGNDGKN